MAQPHTPGSRARAAKQRAPAASVLLRLVDDFLLVTPSRAAAEAVALRMLQGDLPTFTSSLCMQYEGTDKKDHTKASDLCMSE